MARLKKNSGKAASVSPGDPAFSIGDLVTPTRHPSWQKLLVAAILLVGLLALAYSYHWEPKIVGAGVVLLAIGSNAITWLIATVGLAPIIGPLLAKILALPLVWLLNGVGYLVSFFAVRRGGTASRDVLISRGLTIALIVGVVIGYIIGKLI